MLSGSSTTCHTRACTDVRWTARPVLAFGQKSISFKIGEVIGPAESPVLHWMFPHGLILWKHRPRGGFERPLTRRGQRPVNPEPGSSDPGTGA